MTIGILKEIAGENRVSMLPESVATLVKLNVALLVEAGAGLTSFASDAEYELAGARIETKAKVIAGAEVLIKNQHPYTRRNCPDERRAGNYGSVESIFQYRPG